MNISVFGLGYVGAVSGACLAELGHHVIGVDVDEFKVNTINDGQSPIVEDLIADLTAGMVQAGRLRAITDAREAVHASDLSIVCVGTPSDPSGALDLTYVRRVSEEIGAALAEKDGPHTVAIRSTVLPGTVDTVVKPALETKSGKQCGIDFHVCFHPEFLREGTSVEDFRKPPKIVIGADSEEAGGAVASLYDGFDAPLFHTSIRAAETVKYADNAFHALKVTFGNEIGTICKALDIDSHEVMRIFCEDRKLNISPAYLMPGFAYGGSCLPKDLRALTHAARSLNLELPVLFNIQRSNDLHVERMVDVIQRMGKKSVGMLGLSFKRGTDDLRESPLVELVERLTGKGYPVAIYDENVLVSRLRGGNKAYIEQRLPHISQLMVEDVDALIDQSELLIVGAAHPAFAGAIEQRANGKMVIDLVGLLKDRQADSPNYHGICW